MNLDEYQAAAKPPEKWDSLPCMVLGLVSETGELASVFMHEWHRQIGHRPLTREEDQCWNALQAAVAAGRQASTVRHNITNHAFAVPFTMASVDPKVISTIAREGGDVLWHVAGVASQVYLLLSELAQKSLALPPSGPKVESPS